MRNAVAAVVITVLKLSICCWGDWTADFAAQNPANMPRVEARYSDASRQSFVIEADNYRLSVPLSKESGAPSFTPFPKESEVNMFAGSGMRIEITDASANVYESAYSKPSRINIYRRGPYYIESHWLDVALTAQSGKAFPANCEVVFHAYPEKLHVSVMLHITEPIEIRNAALIVETDAYTFASPMRCEVTGNTRTNDFILLRRNENKSTAAFIYPATRGIDAVTIDKNNGGIQVYNYLYIDDKHDNSPAKWTKGSKQSLHFEILPMKTDEVSDELEAEVKPLSLASMKAAVGTALGYDPIRGCYKAQTDNPGDFLYHFKNPNSYEKAKLEITNDVIPRKIYILHETRVNSGYIGGGVLLDERGITLPIMVQTCKAFRGEEEEPVYNPNDEPFSETLFPLHLSSEEKRGFTSLHLYQNWGAHPIKQLSSLSTWLDNLQTSTGVPQTACYVPFTLGGIDGVHIADFRPISQKFWTSQPQHSNSGGYSYLQYRDDLGILHYLEYIKTIYRGTGPNWCDFRQIYKSDDGRANVTLDIFELPQDDENRIFARIRVDFQSEIKIKDGDFARNFRLISISSWLNRMRYTHVAYGAHDLQPDITPIKLNDNYTLAGAALPVKNGYAAIYPDIKGSNAILVRNMTGRIDGKAISPGITAIGWNSKGPLHEQGDTMLALTILSEGKTIRPNDYIEADVVLMTYSNDANDYGPARKLAQDYGYEAPRIVSVNGGIKLSDFPTRLKLIGGSRCEFKLTGGAGRIPVIVQGVSDYGKLRLYSTDNGKKLLDHALYGERDGYQTFVDDEGLFGMVFLIDADGKEHEYLVE